MSTIIQEEWRILNALLKGVVDGKLHHRQQGIPVILSRVDKMPEHILHNLVHALSVAIALRVI